MGEIRRGYGSSLFENETMKLLTFSRSAESRPRKSRTSLVASERKEHFNLSFAEFLGGAF